MGHGVERHKKRGERAAAVISARTGGSPARHPNDTARSLTTPDALENLYPCNLLHGCRALAIYIRRAEERALLLYCDYRATPGSVVW